jgi:cytochrome b involved in lipid metabolism
LWLGTIGSFFALQSGEIAQDLIGRSALIHQHEEFAEKSHGVYSTLSLIYLLLAILQYYKPDTYLAQLLNNRKARLAYTLFAGVGVGLLTIVWALGWAITRGADTDPISQWAFKTFVNRDLTTSIWSAQNSNDTNQESTPPVQNINPTDDEDHVDVKNEDDNNLNAVLQNTIVTNTMQYTMDDVKTHNQEGSCWTVIHNKVYDLTAFANKHPWGDRNIVKLCGKDGTSAFEGKHGDQPKPEQMLQWFEIWILN